MSVVLGAALFVVGLIVSVALHEAGHMYAARLLGLHVDAYAIGMGPTLLHKTSTKTGIDYRLAAFPVGGYCAIHGMTTMDVDDDWTDADFMHAMFNASATRRIIVLSAGVITNICLAFVTVLVTAITFFLPQPNPNPHPRVLKVHPDSPAAVAGLSRGDTVSAVDNTAVTTIDDIRRILNEHTNTSVDITYIDQAGVTHTTTITPTNTGTIGVSLDPQTTIMHEFDGVDAVIPAIKHTAGMIEQSVHGLLSLPSKIPDLFLALNPNTVRSADTPVSVVGASHIGGQLVELNQWASFLLLFASINIVLAVFNLIPLPPLDGGHIAVVIYEKLRDAVRTKVLRLPSKGPADYSNILIVIACTSLLLLILGVVSILADIINPLRLQ